MRSVDIARLNWIQGKVTHLRLGASRDFVTVSDPSGICFSFTPQSGCVIEKDRRTLVRDVPAGHVGVAGAEPVSWLRVEHPSEIIEFTAPPDVRLAVCAELGIPDRADLDDLHGRCDPVIWAFSARFRAAARGAVELGDIERDTLLRQIYRRVLETHLGGACTPQHGMLDKRRLQRVVDYVEANLTTDLKVDALASVAALSPFHFLRSFRRATGMTPHDYVRGRRLDRVRQQIARGAKPAVAGLRYGFTHERHFRSIFERHHGFAPEEISPC